MLVYENIYKVKQALARIKRNGYRWGSGSSVHSLENDKVMAFTFGEQAQKDSQHNVDFVFSQARDCGAKMLVLKDAAIQVVTNNGRGEDVAHSMFRRDWLEQFNQWCDSKQMKINWRLENSGVGECVSFQHYLDCFFMPEHVGVYDVATGKKVTNRQSIIQQFWDMGFATWRGRPLGVAQLKWSGTRDELEELTELAAKHWQNGRNNRTEVSAKIVSAWRSINRHAAWPGA